MNVSRFFGLAALAFGLACPARADSVLRADSITANGLVVRRLTCRLEEGGSLAMLQVMATLALQKSALDRCAPSGGAFHVQWQWTHGATHGVEVFDGIPKPKSTCVAASLKSAIPEQEGTCEAVLLVGKEAAATQAAARVIARSPEKMPKK